MSSEKRLHLKEPTCDERLYENQPLANVCSRAGEKVACQLDGVSLQLDRDAVTLGSTHPRGRHLRMNARHFTICSALCIVACAFAASAAEPQPMPSSQQASGASAAPPHSPSSIPRLSQDIKDAIGEATCDADTECQTIGIGVRPCGGPEAFLSWSSKDTDRQRLAALVARHRDARQTENERSGALSDCRVMLDPGAVCRPRARDGARVCQLGQGGQGRAD